MTGTRASVADLAAAQDELYRRETGYRALESTANRRGWDLWTLCARNAAWCRLLAASWERVRRCTPDSLLGRAALNSVFHFDAERHRWRTLARIVADDLAPTDRI